MTEDARTYYDAEYAATYDADWADGPLWSIEAGHTVRSLASVVGTDTRWLDVGCGTGWFLSQFPGVPRAGTDYSPAMLERARAANPDALFFHEADARLPNPEWDGAWDVVSCTGQPYSYFATIDECEDFAENVANWTAPDGTCLVQVCDLRDLVGYEPHYDFDAEVTEGHSISVTGALWTWNDSTGTSHRNMLWPSLDVWVRWFKRWFRTVEVVHWPHDPPAPYLLAPRRLLVMSDKREAGDDRPATVVVHPPPPVDRGDDPPTDAVAEASPPEAPASEDLDVVEGPDLAALPVDAPTAPEPVPLPVVAGPTSAGGPPRVRFTEAPGSVEADHAVVADPASSRSPEGVSTAALARELGRRVVPTGRKGVRKVARRLRRILPG